MKQINVETRSGRRIAKKKYTKRFLSLIAVFAILISAFAYSKSSSADNKRDMENISVELSTEKIDRDTVKIQLDNFAPLIKSLQVSVGIEGNAKFKEDSINWLVTSDSDDVKTHVKMGDNNKSMEIFIVSNEPLNKVGGKLEICEVDVAKEGTGSSTYRIDSKRIADTSYSYVLNDTNKQVSGADMANLNKESLTINSLPVISLKSLPSIVDGNIVISKGDTFDAKSYIEVNDEEDGVISVDKVTVKGKVDTKKVGTYSITYSVADTEGDTVTLDQTVIVEEVVEDIVTNPIITVNNNGQEDGKLIVTAGEADNLLDFVSAVDYLGRNIDVEIKGDYDLATAGEYNVTIIAIDRLGNKSEKELKIIVEKKSVTAPVINNAPTIEASDVNLFVGDKFNELENVTANDKEDGDLTDKIEVIENTVDTTKAGRYIVTYSVSDSEGAKATKTINVVVSIKMTDLEPSKPIEPVEPDKPVDPEEPGNGGDNGNGENPEQPETPEEPGDSDNNGDNNESGETNKPGNGDESEDTETPQVPVNPENPESSDDSKNDSTTNNDKVETENKNEIPKTGQGIFYGVIIAIAVIGIGSGIYLLRKKK